MYELFHVAIFKFSAKSFHTYLAYHSQKFYMHKNIDFCTYVVPETTFMIPSKFYIQKQKKILTKNSLMFWN